jgi:chromosome segregation ATPase
VSTSFIEEASPMTKKTEKDNRSQGLSAQLAAVADNMDKLCGDLRQEQLQNEFLRRELFTFDTENSKLIAKIETLQKTARESSEQAEQRFQTVSMNLQEERRSREKAERRLKEALEINERRVGDLTFSLESEREQHQAEVVRQAELSGFEIKAYREEHAKLLNKYQEIQFSFEEATANAECDHCRELQAQIDLKQSSLALAQKEIQELQKEQEFKTAEAEKAARKAQNEMTSIRKQMSKIKSIEQIRASLEVDKNTSSAPRAKTSKDGLKSFHPDYLKTEQELGEITANIPWVKGANA